MLDKLKEMLILEPQDQKSRLMTDETGVREAPDSSKRRDPKNVITCLTAVSNLPG